jgi:hypothetical protein
VNTGGLLVLNAVRDTHNLEVDMAVDGPADDVLVAVKDCPVSETPLVEAVSITRRVVSHEHGDFPLGLKLSKGSIEPLEDVTWVITLGHEIEVHIVTGFGVDNNNVHSLNILKGTISILDSEALTVVAMLGINYLCLVIKVLVPKLEIESNHWVLLGEVLGVGLDKIVVSLEGVKSVR